ncbi:MAG: hypothetical protein KGH98_00265 [Candidatus Micrarchaeota archaeon]|nr:hypothetical protein [Candidatus Micrarchaeota archaeon]
MKRIPAIDIDTRKLSQEDELNRAVYVLLRGKLNPEKSFLLHAALAFKYMDDRGTLNDVPQRLFGIVGEKVFNGSGDRKLKSLHLTAKFGGLSEIEFAAYRRQVLDAIAANALSEK